MSSMSTAVIQSRTDEELLSKLSPEDLLTLARLNADGFREHLEACRAETNKLQAKNRALQKQLDQFRDRLEGWVVEVIPLAGRKRYATLAMLEEDAESFGWKRCTESNSAGNPCDLLDLHEHGRRW